MNRTLAELLDDLPESEVKKSCFKAVVISKNSTKDFVVKDEDDKTSNLVLDPSYKSDISTGCKYEFYSVIELTINPIFP